VLCTFIRRMCSSSGTCQVNKKPFLKICDDGVVATMRHTCVWHTIMHEVSAHVHEVSAQKVRALEARASLLEGARLTLCTDRVKIVRAQQFHTATVVVNVVAILQKQHTHPKPTRKLSKSLQAHHTASMPFGNQLSSSCTRGLPLFATKSSRPSQFANPISLI
jgi:hypothetical protein